MSKVKVSSIIQVSLPEPAEKKKETPLEDRIRDMVQLVDNNVYTGVEFATLCRLYEALCAGKQTERVSNLKEMIRPVLARKGYFYGR